LLGVAQVIGRRGRSKGESSPVDQAGAHRRAVTTRRYDALLQRDPYFRASQQLRELLETRDYSRWQAVRAANWQGFLQDQIKLMRDAGELEVDFRVAALRVMAEDKPEILLGALMDLLGV